MGKLRLGVFRDESGGWLLGFSRYVGRSSVLVIELWAICDGLRHTWEVGFRGIELETDTRRWFVGSEMVLRINLLAWVGNVHSRGGSLLFHRDRWRCSLLRNNSIGRSGGRQVLHVFKIAAGYDFHFGRFISKTLCFILALLSFML
ncbi:hypothetical protein V6N11_013715 [Hibiscus sabdariffa]|uniref:RNase H type-1 domain-containing protein n=1 Tax=Hibiscus sabdariffa TaxID=183260 RepID=A0ABR1ZJJ7_9ROSI